MKDFQAAFDVDSIFKVFLCLCQLLGCEYSFSKYLSSSRMMHLCIPTCSLVEEAVQHIIFTFFFPYLQSSIHRPRRFLCNVLRFINCLLLFVIRRVLRNVLIKYFPLQCSVSLIKRLKFTYMSSTHHIPSAGGD